MSSASEAAQGGVTPTSVTALGAAGAAPRRRTGVWQRFRRHRVAMVGLVILAALGLCAVFAPIVAHKDPYKTSLSAIRKPPSAAHWLGGDPSGRDVFARLI